MGLIVDVYRSAFVPGDPTNGGISGRASVLCVVNVSGPFEPRENVPPALLVPGPGGVPIVVPSRDADGGMFVPMAGEPGRELGPMHGGNIASSSDGRWRAAVAAIAGATAPHHVSIHDRFESRAQYLSYD